MNGPALAYASAGLFVTGCTVLILIAMWCYCTPREEDDG